MSKLFQFGDKFSLDWKSVGRKQPILLRKEPFLREGSPNCFQLVFRDGNHLDLAKRSTLNAQRPMNGTNIAPRCLRKGAARRPCREGDHRPEAIRLSASFTNSSAAFASPFSCNSRTALCASICLSPSDIN